MSHASSSPRHSVTTAVIIGLEAHPVRLHLDLGAASGHRREPPEVIARAALTASDFDVPPAFTSRLLSTDGTPLDPLVIYRTARELPIALALLVATGVLTHNALADVVVAGELTMAGRIRATSGIVPIAQMAATRRYRAVLVPFEQLAEARLVPGITILPVVTLADAVDRLATLTTTPPAFPATLGSAYTQHPDDPRLSPPLHRALTIAAAGRHPALLIGGPGTGIDFAARQLVRFLPPPDALTVLEIATIYSAAGLPLRLTRPVRVPHHTINGMGLFGEQVRTRLHERPRLADRPGEITLAHHGVLVLADLPDYPTTLLRRLRQVLTAGAVHFPAGGSFPAAPLLIATAAPCPCGTAPSDRCRCTPATVTQYRSRLDALRPFFHMALTVTAPSNDQPHDPLPIPFARIAAAGARLARRTPEPGAPINREEVIAQTIAELDGVDTIAAEHLHEAHALVSAL